MKKYFFLFIVILLFSCKKKEIERVASTDENQPAPYDTAAIDSFSRGAISANIAARIRMSSKSYQDSLALIKQKADEEKKKQEELAKLEKIAKDQLDKDQTKSKEKSDQKQDNIKPSIPDIQPSTPTTEVPAQNPPPSTTEKSQ